MRSLFPFAAHAQHLLFPVHVGEVQAGQFADAQPGGVEEFENGAVALDQQS